MPATCGTATPGGACGLPPLHRGSHLPFPYADPTPPTTPYTPVLPRPRCGTCHGTRTVHATGWFTPATHRPCPACTPPTTQQPQQRNRP